MASELALNTCECQTPPGADSRRQQTSPRTAQFCKAAKPGLRSWSPGPMGINLLLLPTLQPARQGQSPRHGFHTVQNTWPKENAMSALPTPRTPGALSLANRWVRSGGLIFQKPVSPQWPLLPIPQPPLHAAQHCMHIRPQARMQPQSFRAAGCPERPQQKKQVDDVLPPLCLPHPSLAYRSARGPETM